MLLTRALVPVLQGDGLWDLSRDDHETHSRGTMGIFCNRTEAGKHNVISEVDRTPSRDTARARVLQTQPGAGAPAVSRGPGP